MSGIAAIFDKRGTPAGHGAHVALLDAMTSRLRHRGCDGAVVHAHHIGGVAQCALVTTPEDPGARVAVGARGRYIAVADACLDNRAELSAVLGGQNEESTDADLIVRGYARWGAACVTHMAGDFAFCILDLAARELFAARDPFGVRTLYYHDGPHLFRCASEMTALFADDELSRRPDLEQVARFLMDEYTETDATLYHGVRALPPAHHLTLSQRRGLRLARYWRPASRQRSSRNDDLAEELLHVLSEATRSRLRSSTPIGLFLSGGTDSAALAALAERCRREGHGPPQKALVLHASLPYPEDETCYSDAVADMWELPRINARPLDDRDITRPCAVPGHPDIIYDPRNALWTPLLRIASARGIRTALTGEGGDDCLQRTGVEIADALAAGRIGEALTASGVAGNPLRRSSWRRLWNEGMRPLVPCHLRWLAADLFGSSNDESLLAPVHAKQLQAYRRERAAALYGDDRGDLSSRVLCALIERSYGHAALAWADRMAALHQMRLRHPFLDRRVLELLLSVPQRERHVVGLDKPKPVLRRAIRRIVPESVLQRKNSGDYMRYLRTVLLEQHQETVRSLFEPSRLFEAGILQRQAIRNIGSFDPSAPDGAAKLMRLRAAVAMEIWLRQV